jgi:hypothetical protein
VTEVFTELNETWKTQKQAISREEIPALEIARQDCQSRIDRLIDSIETGGPQQLNTHLEKRYFELGEIESKLKMARGKEKPDVTREELQSLVKANVANLLQVLKSDVPLARKILFKYFRRLSLYPETTDTGPVFHVIGEIDLLRLEDNPKYGVLLGREGTLTLQQHTDYFYNFVMPLYPNLEECDLAKAFIGCFWLGPS